MRCKECGSRVSKKNAFCNNCGAKVELDNNTAEIKEAVIEESEAVIEEGKVIEKKSITKLLPVLISVAVIVVIALILLLRPSIYSSDEQYLILEKDDELVVYEKDKEVLTLDYEGEYYLAIYDGDFALMDQSGSDGAYALYAGKISNNVDVEEISDNVHSYDFGGNTIAYIEYEDEEQILYVGDFSELDDVKEIDDEAMDVWVSYDGKGVYYTNIDNDVYSYINGDSDKIAKDAAISFVGEDANQVVVIEDVEDEEQSLVWYKKDDDFELSDSIEFLQYTDYDKLSMVFLADWDNEKECGTLYYADKYGKDPIEIDDDVSDFTLDSYYMEKMSDASEYVFYTKDDALYASKVGTEGEGEEILEFSESTEILAYDEKANVILWYESKDEINYYNLKNDEEGSVDLDDEFVNVEYADDIIVYENADEEVIHVGGEGETTIITGMQWKLIDSRYIFAAVGEEEENESYIYDMIKGEEVLLAEGLYDIQMIDDIVYALGDYDMEDGEGTVYRLKLGKDEPIEIDDDVQGIWTIEN